VRAPPVTSMKCPKAKDAKLGGIIKDRPQASWGEHHSDYFFQSSTALLKRSVFTTVSTLRPNFINDEIQTPGSPALSSSRQIFIGIGFPPAIGIARSRAREVVV